MLTIRYEAPGAKGKLVIKRETISASEYDAKLAMIRAKGYRFVSATAA